MLTIEYAPHGGAVSDFDVERIFQALVPDMLDEAEHSVAFATENIFLRVRVGLARGEITTSEVRFVFESKIVSVDNEGRIEQWPPGFLDTIEELLYQLFGT